MNEKKPVSHIVAGLIVALAVLAVSVGLALTNGANAGAGVGWISVLVMMAGLVFFVRQYGQALSYRATFGDYFNYGFKATTMVVLLYVLYLLALSIAIPDIKKNVLEATRLELERQKTLGDKDRAKAMEMTSQYFWLALIGISVFILASIGAIGSLIGAAITKKLPKTSSEQSSI